MAKEKIILIDGSSYFFRAYFAIQHLSNSKGFPTNAVFGFVNMLLRVLDVEKPSKLAICFDTAKPSFRKEMYDEYKANREAPPDDLVVQIPIIQKAVDGFGIHRLEREGFEADDVIATVVKRATAEGYVVEIISGDKDLMQLVTKKVNLFDTMRDIRYGPEGVFEKFQVKPSQIIDFLALMGDASDNIPGVSGIGKKTAAELLQEYGSLEKLYENLDKIKQKKRREKLEEEKELAFLSQQLVTLDTEVPLEFSWSDFDYRGPIRNQLEPLLQELELFNLIKRLGFGTAAKEDEIKKSKYEVIVEEGKLQQLAKQLASAELVSVDTETTSLSIHDANLVGLSLSGKEGEAYYIPVGHEPSLDSDDLVDKQLKPEVVRKAVRPLLENPEIKKLGQNLKYDIQILKRWDIDLKGVASDTLVASYLINPDQKHDLDSLALRHLGHQNITFEEVTGGKRKKEGSFAEVNISKATDYAAEDADVTLRLHEKLLPELKEGGLLQLYNDVEIPLVEVLADMEYRGLAVDSQCLSKMATELEKELSGIQEKIYELAGEPLNINSPKQLAKLLFEKLKLPTVRKTKTGYSTDERVLEELSSEHEIAQWIVKYRELMKLKSTYVDGLLSVIHPSTQKIHTSFNQTVTATGRLSSSGPNLQNIPVSGNERYPIRAAFLPSSGCELFSADYSQVELRILAHMSEDKELMRAFDNDEDVHAYTGKLIFGVDKVTTEQRRVAKTINFGVVYGQTPYGLSRQLRISPGEAKSFIDGYFQRYAGVKAFMEATIEEAGEKGFVTTLLGRRRFLPEIRSQNRVRREMAERTAINTPIQGSAADLIKVAMVAIYQRLLKEQRKARMILQVHDELVLDVPTDEKAEVEALVRQEMENALDLRVPLRVDIGWGKNWNECK